ncbi:hypothetical protein [Streptomyces sp. MMG1121]|uniref:hypothetical protein n=1 Tax=Streptomyces sp. MMG1121 TaxID=1415544 RepID=UPI0006AFC326|nr:hypothetical protein [Streptomyces sp. MMG1121]KOV59226.1 hypothetical protein ADK64_34370 [Streptomyces sp. MMG1121]
MRRGLVPVMAWLLATGAAVTLSWWGVHTVMAATAYDPPRALPITDTTPQGTQDLASPTRRPPRSASPSGRAPSPTPPHTPAHRPTPSPTATQSASGQVKAYDTDGGRAVFALGTADATLVSATPGTGWSMQVWKTDTWIRVEFSKDTARVSVFCTWHDGPPHVEVGNY